MFSNKLIALAIAGLALIMSGAVIGQIPKARPAASGSGQAKSKKPVAGAATNPRVGPGTTNTQYGADMLEGTNIKQTQPAAVGPKGGKPGAPAARPATSEAGANEPPLDTPPAARRKFDHIGNITTPTPPGASQTAPQIGADMMDGTNIRQEQPGNGGKHPKTPNGNITAQPKPGVVPHTAPQFGADMMEGSNIRQQQPERGGKHPKTANGNVNAQPKSGIVPHTAPQIGADMTEGSNIRQQQPGGKPASKPAAVKPPTPGNRPKHKP